MAPDASWVAGGAGPLQLWDGRQNQPQATLAGHRQRVTSLSIAPDGLLASVSDDGLLLVWDTGTGRTVAAMRTDDQLRFCRWAHGGRMLTACGHAGLYFLDFDPAPASRA